MGAGTALLVVFFGWCLVSTCLEFYKQFHAPACKEVSAARAQKSCLRPSFADGDRVDYYVFLASKANVSWWTAAGFSELALVPLWNATGIKYGESIPSFSVALPLSQEPLRGVRRNESSLYAHTFLIRAGYALHEAVRSAKLVSAPRRGVLSADVLHTSASITRLLPRRQPTRRKLLDDAVGENATDSGDETTVARALSSDEKPVVVALPFGNLRVYPAEALAWVVALLAATSFFEPSDLVAVPRGLLAVVVVPWLYQLRQEQKQLLQEQRLLERRLHVEEDMPQLIVPHLIPAIKVTLAVDTAAYDGASLPPLLYKEMVFENGKMMPSYERDVRYVTISSDQGKLYVPHLAIEQSGFQQRRWHPLDANISTPDPKIGVVVEVGGVMRYRMVETIRRSFEIYLRMGMKEQDFEDVTDFLFRYPLHILVIMQIIGVLQTVLTTLAFKNDITFFRGRSDYSGLSSRSLATDTLHEIIIFFYLYDYEDISRIVLFQVGTSAVIGFWKFARVSRLGVFFAYMQPWISYGRGAKGSAEESTEEIDAKGMRYLKFVLYPLSATWGLYNLYHYHYKSWWSWVVSSLADCAYTFGFVNMMPQIFVNYKLKSVAHMPWRVLMYKFFNTFIDDVFAFFIMSDYMTKKHRYMTLRDDIVFFIFLYQRYIYQVDPNRPDEFGNVYGDVAQQVDANPIANGLLNELFGQNAEATSVLDRCDDAGADAVVENVDRAHPGAEETTVQVAAEIPAAPVAAALLPQPEPVVADAIESVAEVEAPRRRLPSPTKGARSDE